MCESDIVSDGERFEGVLRCERVALKVASRLNDAESERVISFVVDFESDRDHVTKNDSDAVLVLDLI